MCKPTAAIDVIIDVSKPRHAMASPKPPRDEPRKKHVARQSPVWLWRASARPGKREPLKGRPKR